MISSNCPNCGAAMEFDESREFCFCQYCGTKVMHEKVIVEHKGEVKINESEKYKNLLNLADDYYKSKDFKKAYDYYNKCLEIKQDSCTPFCRKAFCLFKNYDDVGYRNEIVHNLNKALSLASENSRKNIANSVINFCKGNMPKNEIRHDTREECDFAVDITISYLEMLDDVYQIISKENCDNLINFADHIVYICSLIDQDYIYTDGQYPYGRYKYKISSSVISRKDKIYEKYLPLSSSDTGKKKGLFSLFKK